MRTEPPGRTTPLALLAALLLGSLLPGAAFAEESWEKPVREAIADQDRELARTSPKQLINRYSGQLSRSDPNDVVTLYLLARAYGKAKDAQNAIVTYGDVLRIEPRLWYAWRDRAALRWEQKDAAGAEADLRQAVALKADFATALQDLATILMAPKRPAPEKGFEEAARLLARVLDVEPGNEKARFQLVNAYLALRRADDGLRELQPMLAREPNHPGLRLKRAELLAVKGRPEESFAEYKRLAVENPAAPEPLRGWLRTAQEARTFPADEGIWVLERLARLARDEERKAILAQVERIRREQAAPRPPEPTGPPTPEQLAALLRSPDEKTRRDVLSWLLARETAGYEFRGPLTAALVERAVRDEPSPTVRALALTVLGKTREELLAPVLRWALYDADADVRAKAADVLAELRSPASIPALLPSALGDPGLKDPAARDLVAVAAQAAIYWIAKVTPPPSDETPAARLVAFRAWWGDVGTRPVKLLAIDKVLAAPDTAPWFLLRPFVEDEDPAVWTRSWYAFKRVAAKATGNSPLEVWLRELPPNDATTLLPEKRAAYVTGMLAWWARRPS
jgi:cytochrome c-type biogenesis protein CcmH/NrfG